MPIYEYACKSCEHQFDALQKMSDPKLLDCPECGEASLKKLLSAPKFRLAGSGWYETDFKTDGKRNLAGDAGKGDSGKGEGGKKDESKKKDSASADKKEAPKKDKKAKIDAKASSA